MALSVKEQTTYWGIAIAVSVVVLWFLGDVILPFVLGGAIAYCLDPVADWLERLGLSRALSVAVITIVGVLLAIILFLMIVPTVIDQAVQFAKALPSYLTRLNAWLLDRFPQLMSEDSALNQQLGQIATRLEEQGGALVRAVLASFSGVLNLAVLFVIVPVVTVYLLVDWDRMIARIDELLPRDHAPVLRRLGGEMDRTLASFIRGQGTVCLIMAVFYALALMIAGLNFGVVIGLVAGLVTFIPYVGAIIGGVLAVGVAIFQTWAASAADPSTTTNVDWIYVLIIYLIFQAGQFVEGNILTPKLVGTSVGLHPVWLLLALSVFGSIFGFVGLLLAVPIAALLGVLVRFGVERYEASLLFRGKSD